MADREYTIEELERYGAAAEAAGDTEAVQAIAQQIVQQRRAMRAQGPSAYAAPAGSEGVTAGALETQRAAQRGDEGRGPSSFGQAFIASQPSAPTAGEVKGIAELPRALAQGYGAYAAGMAASLPTAFGGDTEAALKVLHDTMSNLSYVPQTEEGQLLLEGLARATAPLAEVWKQVGNPGGVGDEYVGEWIQSGFAMISGTAGLRRTRGKISPDILRAQENGFRIAVGELKAGNVDNRELYATLGGKGNTNALILQHNLKHANRLVNEALGLEGTTSLTRDALESAATQQRQLIGSYAQGGGRRNGEILRALTLRERAAAAFADGKTEVGNKLLENARGIEYRNWYEFKHRGGPRGAERAETYRAAVDKLDRFDVVRPFVDSSGNVNAPGLAEALLSNPRRLREGNNLEQLIHFNENFPNSLRAAKDIAAATKGFTMFDVMLAPAVAGVVGGAGWMLADPTGGLASGLATLMAARTLGRKIGSGPIRQLEGRLRPNLREGRIAPLGALDEGIPEEEQQ